MLLRMQQNAVIALIVALFGYAAWTSRTVVDDSYINFRIVANLVEGRGPTFNAGERIEAGTSALWVAILSVAAVLSGSEDGRLALASVVIGIGCGCSALLVAQLCARRVQPFMGANGLWVPVGLLFPLAIPPFREFVASGLEMGLVLLWLACSVLVLLAVDDLSRKWRVALAGFVISLGPLVRPDLGVMFVCFLVALCSNVQSPRRVVTALVSGTLTPILVEVWRMGYYGATVPNTALAKEAFGGRWDQGWIYLDDFLSTYWLAFALIPVLSFLGLLIRRSPAGQRRTLAAVILGAFAHAAYITRFGGDFMHGRMLLPSLFLLTLPTAVWPARISASPSRAVLQVANCLLIGCLLTWSLYCAFWFRVPYQGQIGPAGIADEVNYYRRLAGHSNPVTPDDYLDIKFVDSVRGGRRLSELASRGERFLQVDGERWALKAETKARIVMGAGVIGLFGFVAGPGIHVVDYFGLADPLAARLRLSSRGRPGHEKLLAPEWVLARFLDSDSLELVKPKYPKLAVAVSVLSCRPVRELLEATTAPLSFRRFFLNVMAAPRLTRLRLPNDPLEAHRELCER